MIYILIPIYNEEGNIQNLYNELVNVLPGEEKYFIFSDDGSNDNTITLLKEKFTNFNYHIIGDGINRGPGAAFNIGFEWILAHSKSDEDIVVTLEADCTSDITLLSKMIAMNRLGFDLVLASVYAQGGGFDETNWFRKFLSAFANLMFRFLFDIKVLTLSSFYRVYSIKLLNKIKSVDSQIITENGFICMLEILVKAIASNAKILEVPMTLYSKKRVGKSKMKIIKTTVAYFKYLLFKKKT